MKKKWVLIILGIIAIIVVLIIILSIRREKRINHFDFPTTIIANNYTKYKRADTLAMIIINKMFRYDTIILNIYNMNKPMGNDEFMVAGFIQKNQFEPHNYNIFVKKTSLPISIKKFLSHELQHLDQMEKGDLVQLFNDNTKIVYKGDTIYYSEVPYDKRLYEIHAHFNETTTEKQLNHLLYSKKP